MKKACVYGIWQCLWGLPQSAAGFLLFLRYRRCPHQIVSGITHTGWDRADGISLGLFIFTPQGEDPETKAMIAHEFGHTVQSAILGPLYLPVIGLPSLVWARSRRCQKLRGERGISYYSFFTERWADQLGAKLGAGDMFMKK